MSDKNVPITIQILDKEYRIACPQGEEEALQASARFLNTRIQEVRENGKAIGSDRVAVIAALNLAHEYLSNQHEQEVQSKRVSTRVRSLHERIDHAIKSAQQLEL